MYETGERLCTEYALLDSCFLFGTLRAPSGGASWESYCIITCPRALGGARPRGLRVPGPQSKPAQRPRVCRELIKSKPLASSGERVQLRWARRRDERSDGRRATAGPKDFARARGPKDSITICCTIGLLIRSEPLHQTALFLYESIRSSRVTWHLRRQLTLGHNTSPPGWSAV